MTTEEEQPKRFPLLLDWSFRRKHPTWLQWIPWAIAEQAYKEYKRRGHGDQSLERVAERGGFSPEEIDALMTGQYNGAGLRELEKGEEDFRRSASEMVCERCGCQYWEHPPSPYYIDTLTNLPWLHRLCDGTLVKL
jgi:hypothetical protein